MKNFLRALYPLILLTLTGCMKKENSPVEARRKPEDTLSLVRILQSDDANPIKSDFNLWLQTYPDEVNRIFPGEATTPLGLISQKYFHATAEQKLLWAEMMFLLLDHGADPNVFFPYAEARRGLTHLAMEQDDQTLVRALINQQGTLDPALRLSCDTAQGVPTMITRPGLKPLNLNLQEESSGMSPLHYAVQRPNPDPNFIEYLLLHGASPDLSDASIHLVSPYQWSASNTILAPILEKYSGSLVRYEARLNSFINDEIEAKPEARKTILDLAKAYQDIIEKEGFQDVQDINRIIPLCKSGETVNLLGYAVQHLLPAVSTRVVQAAKARNDSIQSWISTYGAKICLKTNLNIRHTTTQEILASHAQASIPAIKNFDRTLWCNIVRPQAIADGCWEAGTDDLLTSDLACPPL